MIRHAPLRRTGRLKAMSKRRRASQKFTKSDPVYQAVDRRSGGRCEVVLVVNDGFTWRARCPERQRDHHHCLKPRETFNDVRYVIGVCRACHDLAEAERLAIVANGDGTFTCRLGGAP